MRSRKTCIPTDLLMEILKLLPSKSLMRFRCVSKPWNCIIRDPVFVKLHGAISITRPGGTATILSKCGNEYSCLYFWKINHQREAIHELRIDTSIFGNITISASRIVNGLICFWEDNSKARVRVCNITTHEVISLPTHPNPGIQSVYSLGYDPLNNEYKVFGITIGLMSKSFTVFTIWKDKEWRGVIDPLDLNLQPKYFHEVKDMLYHDGAIHWLSPNKDKQKLIAFDVREEKFWTIGIPNVPIQARLKVLKLVKMGDHIVLYAFMGGSNIFILEDYQNHVWIERNIQFPDRIYPIGSMNNKLIFHRAPSIKKFAFDPNNGEVSQIEIIGLDRMMTGYPKPSESKFSISEAVENIYPLRQY